MDLTRITKWQLQSGEVLHSSQMFSKIVAKEIDSNGMCRAENSAWQPVHNVFEIVGRYGILRELGSGAFGNVYLGLEINHKDPGKQRLVAIKKPTKSVFRQVAEESGKKGQEGEMWARMAIGQTFSEEVSLTARMAICPYVVKVLDHSVSVPYIVLEFCNGGTLAQRITKPYTMNDVKKWGEQIARGLHAAHTLEPDHLIHRDLKPQNILLHKENIKISDFGTSKMAYMTQSLRSLKGGYTPKYAAPEAINGKAHTATDIWSFGVIMYQLISGEFPFVGGTITELMTKIMCQDPAPLWQQRKMEIDSAICALVDQCLQKDIESRPSAAACVQAFSKDFHFAQAQLKSISPQEEISIKEISIQEISIKEPPQKESVTKKSPETLDFVEEKIPVIHKEPTRETSAGTPKKKKRSLMKLVVKLILLIVLITAGIFAWTELHQKGTTTIRQTFSEQKRVNDGKRAVVYQQNFDLSHWKDVAQMEIQIDVSYKFINLNGTSLHQVWVIGVNGKAAHEIPVILTSEKGPLNKKATIKALIPYEKRVTLELQHYIISGVFRMVVTEANFTVTPF